MFDRFDLTYFMFSKKISCITSHHNSFILIKFQIWKYLNFKMLLFDLCLHISRRKLKEEFFCQIHFFSLFLPKL